MTLPSTNNTIKISNINVEIGLAATTPNSNLNKVSFRELAGVTGSGTKISMSNFWGKSHGNINYKVDYNLGERGRENWTVSSSYPIPHPSISFSLQGNSFQLYGISCTRYYSGSGVNSTYNTDTLALIGGSFYSRYIFDSITGNGITRLTGDANCSFFYNSANNTSVWMWTDFGGPGQGTILPTPPYTVDQSGTRLTTISYSA
jgi:hypothetical protein